MPANETDVGEGVINKGQSKINEQHKPVRIFASLGENSIPSFSHSQNRWDL